MKTHPLIYLIHGTWGRDAAFLQSGSEFQSAIAKTLQAKRGANPEYRSFDWTGENTLASRLSAAKALVDQVEQELVQSDPDRPVFLISHSHGGSVVAIAMKNSAIMRDRITGVVTMAVPFVEIGPSAFAKRAACFAYFIFMCLFSFFLMSMVTFIGGLYASIVSIFVLVPLFVTIIHTLDRRLLIVRRAFVMLWRERKIMNTAKFTTQNLLVVSTPGDEARFVLAIATYLIRFSQLLVRLSSYLGLILPTGSTEKNRYGKLRIISVFFYRYGLYVFFTFIMFLALFVGSSIFDIEQWKDAFYAEECVVKNASGDLSAGFAAAACSVVDGLRLALRIVVLNLPVLVLAAIFLLAILTGGVMYRMVGWFGPLHVVFSRISLNALPLQGGDFLRLPDRPRRFLFWLRHSEVYLDPAMTRNIADWIANCCRGKPAPLANRRRPSLKTRSG